MYIEDVRILTSPVIIDRREMKAVKADIWDLHAQGMAVVVPTNMCVNGKGEAVMGAGLALQAARRFPWLPKQYGEYLQLGIPRGIFEEVRLVMVPTKRHWKDPSTLELVEAGVRWLTSQEPLFAVRGWEVAVPPLGCGLGGLKLAQVQPIMEKWLSDRFVLVLRP